MRAAEQQLDEALAVYRRLLGEPQTAIELGNRGVELMALGDHAGSIEYFERALRQNPLDAIACYNRATSSNILRRFAEALAGYDRALLLGMDIADLHHNRGISLFNLDQPQAALASLERALELSDEKTAAPILNTQGFVLQSQRCFEQARISYARALALDPELALARLNLGIVCLTLGDWKEGWEGYEWRWTGAHEAAQGSFKRPHTSLPQWNGEAVQAGDSLLVLAEQGFGDMLQFSRYIALAAGLFSRVSLACPDSLARLLRASFGGNIEILDLIPPDQGAWQWQCPLLSLPRAFKTTVDNVPATVPYLFPTPELAQKWQQRLAAVVGKRMAVGLVWAGGRNMKEDAKRSIALMRLAPLFQARGIVLISLQKGEAAGQMAQVPGASGMLDWTAELADFADTAALVSALDLIISVDTAVVHLAGALGKPVWLLNRFDSEWRWMREREDSPWYPTLRIFNQLGAGDWDEVLSRVLAALSGGGIARPHVV